MGRDNQVAVTRPECFIRITKRSISLVYEQREPMSISSEVSRFQMVTIYG